MLNLYSSRIFPQLVFQVGYSIFALVCILWIAISLQAGRSGNYLFIVNDLATEPQRLAFVLGFPATYLASLLVLNYTLRIARFDFFNRIIAINVAAYSFLGLALSALRLPLFSREVFVSEFFASSTLLVFYTILSHRLFPKYVGVLSGVEINPFERHPSLKAIRVDAASVLKHRLDAVVTNLREIPDQNTGDLLATLSQQRIPVYDASKLIEMLWGRIPLAKLTLAEIESFAPPVIYKQIKRFGELALVVACLPLLIILSLIIGIAIKLDSPGPVLFRQQRTGLAGEIFSMPKFRSMFVSQSTENRFADEKDKRVTRVGRVLRRLRLDELPQVWNVLLGDMSLIGPRPEQQQFTERFNQMIPFYGFRHIIRPGITGWAQVMYGYAASDDQTRAKLEFDFYYIKHMSFWLDFVVFLKTLRTIIIGSGAR